MRSIASKSLPATSLSRLAASCETCAMPHAMSLAWHYFQRFESTLLRRRFPPFAEPFEAEKIKIDLNRCIREGREVDPDSFNNSRLISYWFLIKSIKEDMLFLCRNNGPKAYIDNKQCGGEGYVRTNEFGMFKLVNREKFSHANFNLAKSWS